MRPRFQHIALRVADLERAVRFYCDGFDAMTVKIGVVDGGGAIGSMFTGNETANARFAQLAVGGDRGIELFEFDSGVPIPRSDQIRDGFMHFGFQVDDVPAALERAEHSGGRRCFPIGEIGASGPYVFLRDPDDHVIELNDGSWERLMRRVVDGETHATSPPIGRAALHHIGIRVRDMRLAANGYREMFGAVVRGFIDAPCEIAQKHFEGPADTTVGIAFLDLAPGFGCELFEFSHPKAAFAPAMQSHDAVMHIGFQSVDLERTSADILRNGGRPTGTPNAAKASLAEYADTDGHTIELTTMDFATYAESWSHSVGVSPRPHLRRSGS